MLRAIDCAAGLLVTMVGECRVLCPEHGGADDCEVRIQYRTRRRSLEAGALRAYLGGFADRRYYAEELAEVIQAAVEEAIEVPTAVTVSHATEGLRLTVTAGAL